MVREQQFHPGNWMNSPKDEWWSTQTGDRQSRTFKYVFWAVPTCAEFWWDQNGTYTRYGAVVCTSA